MTTMASQITSLTIVNSTVYSDADQGKHQSSASLAFVWGIHRDRWIPCTKGQLRGKCFHLMTSSCFAKFHWQSIILCIYFTGWSYINDRWHLSKSRGMLSADIVSCTKDDHMSYETVGVLIKSYKWRYLPGTVIIKPCLCSLLSRTI